MTHCKHAIITAIFPKHQYNPSKKEVSRLLVSVKDLGREGVTSFISSYSVLTVCAVGLLMVLYSSMDQSCTGGQNKEPAGGLCINEAGLITLFYV